MEHGMLINTILLLRILNILEGHGCDRAVEDLRVAMESAPESVCIVNKILK